jgi:phosphotransferase family enzyme
MHAEDSRPRIEEVTAERVQHYLRRSGYPDAIVSEIRPIGDTKPGHLKSHGYGKPLQVTFRSQGRAHHLVIRTMNPDGFGHDRRADRFESFILAYDTFDRVPRHVRAIDAGAFDEAGNLVSAARGEAFLLTEFVGGELYAKDLMGLASHRVAPPLAVARVRALALYLADLHRVSASPEAYVRSIRDVVGHGEGIFGLVDSYPETHPVVPRSRAEKIELEAVRIRADLRRRGHRARRTHGDFHPFNILFREGCDFSLLDASRGGAGDPADDVACLTINFIFFALTNGDVRFDGAMRMLWDEFWSVYLETADDGELFSVVPLFYAWRALVVASPIWYPSISDPTRDRLFTFAERLLQGEPFTPNDVDSLLR